MTEAPKASYGSRVGATLIDALILTAVALSIGIVIGVSGGGGDGTIISIYVVAIGASLLYGPGLMARGGDVNGQTIGKRAMGIRVVPVAGGPMTFGQGLMRDGVGKALLGIIPLYTIVDLLLPLADQQRQAIHDKVGSTYVVLASVTPGRPLAAPPQDAWSAPAPTAVPPPPPAPPAPPAPPVAPAPDPSQAPPDLGGFIPPGAPPPPPSSPEEDEPPRGPFGPSYGEDA